MVSIQVTRRYNRAESTILGLVSLGEGLEVAGSVGSCVSAMFRSRVRSWSLVGVWRIATRSSLARGGSGSRRVGRFVRLGVVRSQVRSWGLVGVWRIATSVWVCLGVVG